MLPPRLTRAELAALWKLTPTRVGQFVTSGRLRAGADGKIDRDEAIAFRKVQMAENDVHALFKRVGSKAGTSPPKVLEHVGVGGADPELDDEEPWPGFNPPKPAPVPQTALEQIGEAVSRVNETAILRREEAQERIRKIRIKNDREAGELLSRKEVRRQGAKAAKTAAGILQGLPAEIAKVFADLDTRSAVRQRVQDAVDRALFALHQGIAAAAPEDDDE